MNEYCVINLLINDTIKKSRVTAFFLIKTHLINDFRVNMLIKTDIITSQQLCINLKK